MNESFSLGLVYNASLLLAMVFIFDLLSEKLKRSQSCLWRILAGLSLGGIGLAVMSTNWQLIPGVVFDTRSVLLSVTGLYFGWVPTVIAMVVTSVYRIYQGGSGVLMGVPVILLSCLIGLTWRAIRVKSLHKLSWVELCVFGIVVHVGMMLCTFLLPADIRVGIQRNIWLPVLTIYPVATLVFGLLMSSRLRKEYMVIELAESEEKLRDAQKLAKMGYWSWDIKSGKVEWSEEVYKIFHLDPSIFVPNIDSIMKMSPWQEDNNRDKELIRRATKNHEIGSYEQRFLLPDKSVGCYRSSFQGKYDESGKLISIVGTIIDITEQANLQSRIKESEKQFRGLFNSMIEGSAFHELIFDENNKPVNYRLIDVNPAYKRQTGIKIDVRNKLATEIYKTKEPAYLKEFSSVVLTGKSLEFETDFSPLGKRFKIAVFAISNSQFATIFEDITQQHKNIEELRLSEEKFSKMFKSSPYIIIMTRADDGKIVEVNDAFVELSGYTRDEALVGTSVGLGLWAHIDDRKTVLKEILSGVEIKNREYQFKRKNGEILTGLFSSQIIRVKGVPYILAIIEDISERKIFEARLEKVNAEILTEKNKLESILRDIGDAVFVTDTNKNIIMANRAMENLFGFSEKKMIGKNMEKILKMNYESTGEKPLDLINDVFIKKEIVKPVKNIIINKNGKESISIDGVASPILDDTGTLLGTVWVLRDVSKEKDLQKMRLDFISLASHQLRTPLTGIKWFVELLDENAAKMPTDKVVEYIRKIGDSNDRMIDLVNDLMATSRADSGKIDKDVSSYSIKDLLQQAIDEQGRIFLDKNIQIEGVKEIPLNLELEVDMVQMAQVFGNLFNNAASYSPAGSSIGVEVKKTNGFVKIAVIDHGIGIPQAQQEKMFQKFFRADNVAKTIPGSGLGLYVAKSIVESHGGKIWFESKENLGTTFYVELPIKQKNGK